MLVASLIKIAFIIIGITVAIFAIISLAKRSNTITFTIIWIISGGALIFGGIFIEPYNWEYIIGIPTIIIFGVLGLSIIALFWYTTKKNDELQYRFKELAIRETLLNDENKSIQNQINDLKTDVRFNTTEINYIKNNTLKMFDNSNFLSNQKIYNKRILFVNNTLSTGGAEKLLLQTMKQFVNDGNKVYLYIMTGMGELINFIPKEVTLLNANFDSESVLSTLGKKRLRSKVITAEAKNLTWLKLAGYSLKALKDMIKNGKIHAEKLAWRAIAETSPNITDQYDIAIAFTEGASTYYVADKVNAKYKIAFVHISYENAGYTKHLDKNSYDAYNEIIAVSNEVHDSFLKVHPECKSRTYIHEYNINQETIISLSNADIELSNVWDLSDNSIEYKKRKTPRILTVSRLVAQKGYVNMIEAAKILDSAGFDFKWVALGEGEDKEYLQKLIDKYNLNEKFVLLGNVRNPYPYMKNCDVFVHATNYEGKSISVMEAKALGCPIVITKVPGNQDQIMDKQTGLYCEPKPKDIANKIKFLVENPSKARELGKNAKHSCK